MKKTSKIPKTFFLFILASASIWLLNTFSKEYQSQISYTLKYHNLPQDKLLLSSPTKKLDVLVNGSGFKILLANLKHKTINLNASNLAKGKNDSHYILVKNQLSVIRTQIHSGLQVLAIEKDTLQLNLSSLITKKIPVAPNVNLQYHVGYDLIEDLVVSPDSLLVSGPKMLIESLKEIPLNTLTLKDIKSNFSQDVSVKTFKKANNLKYNTNKVTIIGKVDKFTEGALKVPFTIKNVPDSIKVTTLSELVEIKFVVALSNFNKITENSLILECDFKASQQNNLNYLIPKLVAKPSVIKSYKITPNKIDYLIRK